MRANACFGLALAALAIVALASPAMADKCFGRAPGGNGQPYMFQCAGGFGDRLAVTLPPDRHPAAGTNTGIAISKGAGPTIPPPMYFRPR